MEAASSERRKEKEAQEKRVGPLELFFDLVFVFALTQVTGFMADEPTWSGLGKGMLILAALWWAWGAYAWLTNYVNAEEGAERLLVFGAMGAFLVAALAVPGAFGDSAMLFAVAYAAARLLHIFTFAEANDDVNAGTAIRVLARTAVPAPLLLVVAAFFEPPVQVVIWIVALSIDFAGPFVYGVKGFRVSAGHFAERFALIVIIALGESIVAIGTGLTGELDVGLAAAALVGLALACALWWAYFDVVAVVAERRFVAAEARFLETERTAGGDPNKIDYEVVYIARDSYSYLHLPMIAGIILIALGIKKTVGDVGEPLKDMPAFALFGGMALYYAGHVGFRLRNVHSLNVQRLAATLLCLGLAPLATEVDAIVALGVATAIAGLLVAYEAVHFRDARRRVRGLTSA